MVLDHDAAKKAEMVGVSRSLVRQDALNQQCSRRSCAMKTNAGRRLAGTWPEQAFFVAICI
jgi:hypothetical protein